MSYWAGAPLGYCFFCLFVRHCPCAAVAAVLVSIKVDAEIERLNVLSGLLDVECGNGFVQCATFFL